MEADAEAAFSDFVASRLPALLRLGHLLTGSKPDAEDLVQTALVKTYRAWPRVLRQDAPEAYVRRVMLNTYRSWWRYRLSREVITAALPERLAAEQLNDEREVVWRALATLPKRQRAVLVLRYYEDLSEADIAAALGCSVGTVKSAASRGLARLRETSGLRSPVEEPS